MARPKKIQEPAATKEGIQFFGDIDLGTDNKIKSHLPAWYFDQAIDEMQNSIERKERALEHHLIKEELIQTTKNEIVAERERLKEILSSKPALGANQDRCASAYKSLGEQIKDTMPTRKQAKDGLVNPHQELKRLKTKHIKIDPDIAAACGVKAVGGKVTGDEAARCYKILGKALGENTNVEYLRRDGSMPSYQSMHELTAAIIEGMKSGRMPDVGR